MGDCIHVAHAVQLFKAEGYRVQVKIEDNKRWIWEVAGVEIANETNFPPHNYGYRPSMGAFFDLTIPDYDGNKIVGFFHDNCLPTIGTRQQIWDRLCEVDLSERAADMISADARREAACFLDGCPRPIIVLHSKGTNWQAEKSIPDPLAYALLNALVEETGGTVVVLDFDARVPTISGHPRIKNIKPAWGHISLDRQAALMVQSDLVIGVDSGPFHLAQMLRVPAVGVFLKIPAARCCLPSPASTYLIPENHIPCRIIGKIRWNNKIYASSGPSIDDIMNAVEDRLNAEVIDAEFKLVYGERAIPSPSVFQIAEAKSLDIKPIKAMTTADAIRTAAAVLAQQERELQTVNSEVQSLWESINPPPVVGTNYGLAFDSGSGLHVRQGSLGQQDMDVVRDVWYSDSYHLKCRPHYGDNEVVVDIGAHIGSFAMAWHKKNPKARIVCVEACPDNMKLLQLNVGDFATVINAACTYEEGEVILMNSILPDGSGTATGGSWIRPAEFKAPHDQQLYWRDPRAVKTVTLEQILALAGLWYCDVLKLDCEGSEFSILGNSPMLSGIRFIVGEYHGKERFFELLKRRFPSANWAFGHMHDSNDLGIFHLENRRHFPPDARHNRDPQAVAPQPREWGSY